jgi:uncharacterized iron-regulated protein
MIRSIIFSLFVISFSITSFSQHKEAYVIFNSKGKKVSYQQMEKAILKKKFVFFGELHNDPIAHWLQYELLTSLHKKHGDKLIAGSEMYERDQQIFINQYLKGEIDKKQLVEATKLWSNFETDYLPMLNYAKENSIPWIATNTVRKYASLIYKKGRESLDSLSENEKKLFAPSNFPVDLALSQYDNLLKEFSHAGPNFVYAQAIKDATMGESIVRAMKENSVFYHLNGSYHSDFHQGIMWYVNYYGKFEFKEMISISVVSQAELKKLDSVYFGKADFIICTPETMTKTH